MGRVVATALGEDVVEIVLDNEPRLNALTVAMWRDLAAVIGDCASRPALRCLVIRGAGRKAFSAGADISEFATTRSTSEQVEVFHEGIVGPCLRALIDCPVPVVAAIRGICMGGGLEIATLCDLRLGDVTARLGAPVGRLGFPLAFGETQALYNLLGPTTCSEVLIEGRVFTADEARERRLLTRVTEPDALDDEVRATVEAIRASGIAAARAHKRQIRRLMADPSPVSYAERLGSYEFASTEEYRTGVRAFLDKRRTRRA
jgi:enoyl-CoA hydratase/carnithine racemase